MKKMGMRVISAALAACMMATVLPVGAFASGGGTTAENSVSTQAAATQLVGDETIDDAYIAAHGNTFTLSGTYEHTIVIDTTGNVTINVVGTVEFTRNRLIFLSVHNIGELTIHSENCVIQASETIATELLSIENTAQNADVTVYGGTYSGYGAPVFYVDAGTLNLNDVTVADTDKHAVYNKGGTVNITGGSYSGSGKGYATLLNAGTLTVKDAKVDSTKSNSVYNKGGTVNITGGTFTSENNPTISTGADTTTNIHSGTYKRTGSNGQVFTNYGTLTIDDDEGKTFINNPNGTAVTVFNNGKLSFKGGTVTSPYSSAIACVADNPAAELEITGGTIKDSKYGIEVRRNDPNVVLKNVTFENNANDIYLGADQKITIEDTFTKRATVKVVESSITTPRPVTTTTAQNQDKLNLVSNDKDTNGNPYVVAYDTTDGHRYLTTRGEHQYFVSAESATATADLEDGNGEQTLYSYTPVSAGTKVTLTANAPDEGWVFTGWQVTSPTGGVELTTPDGTIVNLQDVTDTTVTFAMPESDVVVSAQYEYVGIDGGDGGAGAVVAGVLIGGTAYLLTTRVWLEGTIGYVPANRIELALGLWKHADCPDPVSTELYPDIDADDTDAQKAARWCVEQDLMKEFTSTNSDGTQTVKFKPYGYVFRPYSLVNWYKLEKLLNQQKNANA